MKKEAGQKPASSLRRDRLQFEVEHIQDKESPAVNQHNVTANDGVHVARRRRWQIAHNLDWARMHFATQSGW